MSNEVVIRVTVNNDTQAGADVSDAFREMALACLGVPNADAIAQIDRALQDACGTAGVMAADAVHAMAMVSLGVAEAAAPKGRS